MRIKKYKKSIISFIFLFSLLSFKLSIAQSGVSRFDAYNGSDAEYSQLFSIPNSSKEVWHKFKVESNVPKTISITTKGLNPLNKIELVKLYTGTASNLQFIMDSPLIVSTDTVVRIFLDTGIVAINDTIYLRLLKGTNSSCINCQNNIPLNYLLEILTPECGYAGITLSSHYPFENISCQVFTPNAPGVACTLKVCANEQICIDASFKELGHGGYFMCATGTVNFGSQLPNSSIQYSSNLVLGTYQNTYCFTTTTTPGIYPVTVCWKYNSDCSPSGGIEPDRTVTNCCGTFFIEVGPTAPPNNGYTIYPNPVCKGAQACFTADPPNTPSYSYLFSTGLNSPGAVISPTGELCATYTANAGTYNTSLTIYNGYCPSPTVTQQLIVKNPSATFEVTPGLCRNWHFQAETFCMPENITLSWNVGGTIYTGNDFYADFPGNSSSVPVTLSVLSSTGVVIYTTSTTINNIPTFSASISYSSDNCGNHTYIANPSACVPSNAIYNWIYNGVTNIGQTVTIANNTSLGNFMTMTLNITLPNGTVLYTYTYNQAIPLNPTTCCGNNTVCANRFGGCTPAIINSSNAETIFSGIQIIDNKMYTVAANTTIVIPSNAQITFNNCSFLMYEGSSIQIERYTSLPNNKYSLVFNECYLRGCEKLWEGIKLKSGSGVIGNQPRVLIKKSMIEDAVAAFDFSAANDLIVLQVENTIFNKNLRGIKFISKSNVYSQFNILSVTGSVFTSKEFDVVTTGLPFGGQAFYNTNLASANNDNLKPKFGVSYHAKSLIGIEINGVPQGSGFEATASNITISEGIIYDNLVQGVAIKGLNIARFKSNTFKNITSPILNGDYPTYTSTQAGTTYTVQAAAIYYTGATNVYSNIGVGPTTSNPTQKNTFTNCYYGVYAKNKPFDVQKNDFTNCYNGVYQANSNVPAANNTTVNALIGNNRLTNLKYTAFYFYQNASIYSKVTNNTITYSSTANYNFTSRGVQIHEQTQPVAAKYEVTNNIFTKIFEGININNANGTLVENNTISLNSTAPSYNFNAGVVLNNCYAAKVQYNRIDGNGNQNAWQECGIRGHYSNLSTISCNTIRNSFTGFGFHGPSSSDVFKNDIYNAKYGVWNAFSAAIGNQDNPNLAAQGFAGQPSENRWFNTLSAPIIWHSFMAVASDGSQNIFYTRSNYPHSMLLNDFDTPPSSTMLPFPVSNPLLPYTGNCNTGIINGRLMRLAPQIAQDVLYPANNIVGKNVSKRALLTNLINENINTQGNAVLDNFKITELQTNIGKFNKIDERIKEAIALNDSILLDSVEYVNTSLSASDSVEMLQKQVTQIYLNYVKNDFDLLASDMVDLDAIAKLCPYQYGTSIFQARSLINPYVPNYVYQNECEKLQADFTSSIRSIAPEYIEEPSIDLVGKAIAVYPNPNDGAFNVLVKADVEIVTIELFGLLGNKIMEAEYKLSPDKVITVKLDLKEGAYMLKVSTKNLTIGTERLIITK